jgi:asparagine synthase (glutamine-hydrolysing)
VSALFGIVSFAAASNLDALGRHMASAQRAYGPHGADQVEQGNVLIGRCLWRTLPEDEFDAQPLSGGGGRFRLVADIRLDNRDEIISSLGASRAEWQRRSDSFVLLKAWERWEERMFPRLVGDFACAIWDNERRRLILARDALGERPLYFHRGCSLFAFASMPSGLFALEEIPSRPDSNRVTGWMLDQSKGEGTSFFKDVERVRPGHYAIFDGERLTQVRHWDPRPQERRLPRQADYIEAFRHHLDQATRSRLRGVKDVVATHLSCGWDSSAVTSTAARLLAPSGGRVLALTSGPRPGFQGSVPRGRLGDETAIAAQTAALYPNMEHVVIRSGSTSPLALLDRNFDLFQEPAANICNNVWWSAINDEIRARGVNVLLSGGYGNITLNAGNLNVLADFVHSGQMLRWWRECRLLVSRSPARWRGVLANSFGAWLPSSVWTGLSKHFQGSDASERQTYVLYERWKESNKRRPVNQPGADTYALRKSLLQRLDVGNARKGLLAGWGIDERDPTGDIRLIDFCLSLPRDQLLRDGVMRPLARAALADRLPAAVLENRLRGYQFADWHEHLTKEAMLRETDEIAANPCASSVIDTARIRSMIEEWPPSGGKGWEAVVAYRVRMLQAFSAGHFLRRAAGDRPC